MSIEFLLPVFLGIVFFAVVILITVYRPHPRNIDNVILFAGRLDPLDLEGLRDAGEEWNLRQSLTTWAFRRPRRTGSGWRGNICVESPIMPS